MNKFKIKSFCKINLFLKVVKKLNNGYHNIKTLITFCNLYDVINISIAKGAKDNIIFSGKFKKGINKKSNIVTKALNILRKNGFLKKNIFKIDIKKNIPHGSGLGGGSSNAADLLNHFNQKMQLKIKKKRLEKLAKKIGYDVPICLEKKNTFITGKKDKFLRLNQKFKLNLLIVYPNLVCSTKKIYKNNKKKILNKKNTSFYFKNEKQLINFLKNESNDLEETVIKIYPKISELIKYIKFQKGCYISRITGSGSACFGIFSSISKAIYAQKLIKLKYPNYWCVVSKTI